MKSILMSACVLCFAGAAQANTIRNACLAAPKPGGVALCSCIQSAADRTLTKRDQKLAASFFRDPDKAQSVRQSGRRSHETFWERYKAFGAFAEAYCS